MSCGPIKAKNETQIEKKTHLDTFSSRSINIFDSISVNYLLGRFEPSEDSNFVKIEAPYGAGNGLGYIHKDTYKAFKQMYHAAKTEGVTLVIKSPTRNFFRQKAIWEAKWKGERKVEGKNLALSIKDPQARALAILRYSSMPGTSRHHWGTDIDLNEFENDYFKSGKGLEEYNWLLAHAHQYGFCQPYTEKGTKRPDGYEEERWHWSYTPLAKKYLASYKLLISDDAIHGFLGAEVAVDIKVVQKYVLGINEACK